MQPPTTAGVWVAGSVTILLAVAACEHDEPLPQQGPAEHGGRAYAAGTAPPSAGDAIVERVRAELARDPAVGALVIDVESGAGGRVYLRGFVASPMQKTRAAEIVQRVDGVTGIDNRLIPGARSGVPDGPLAETRLYL